MYRSSYEVVENRNKEGWSISREKTNHSSIQTQTKAEAVRIGRIICQRQGAELKIVDNDSSSK